MTNETTLMSNDERRTLTDRIQAPWIRSTVQKMIEDGLMEERRRMDDAARSMNRRWDDHPDPAQSELERFERLGRRLADGEVI